MTLTQDAALPEAPQQFAARIGLSFSDIGLLNRALTHRSYLNENAGDVIEDNERLEFLGDAVLDFVVGVWVYHHYPEMREGELTRLRSSFVRTEQLADFARQIDLGRALRLGRGEEASGGRDRDTLLCDAFEALIGAMYLDQGVEAVVSFMEPFLEAAEEEALLGGKDPKSRLQEVVQREGSPPPTYRVVSVSGPDHRRMFVVAVDVRGQEMGRGTGSSKRIAAKNAARDALRRLGEL